MRLLSMYLSCCAIGCTSGAGVLQAIPPPPEDLSLGQGTPPRTAVGTGPADIWAYLPDATTGHLLHYDGHAWTAIQLPATPPLNANSVVIAAGAPGEVWVVAPSTDTVAKMIHIAVLSVAADGTVTDHGDVFAPQPVSSTNGYGAVHAGSRNGVIAIVAERVGTVPVVNVFSGSSAMDISPTGVDVRAPLVVTADDIYAVTGAGLDGLGHYDGQTWTQLPEPAYVPNRVSVAPSGEAWLFPIVDQAMLAGGGSIDGVVLHGRAGSVAPISIVLPPGNAEDWTPEFVVGVGDETCALVGKARDSSGFKLASRTASDGAMLTPHDDNDLTGTDDCLSSGGICPQVATVVAQLGDDSLLMNAGATVMPLVDHFYILHRSDL